MADTSRVGFLARRRLRRTCPRCHNRSLTRIEQREGLMGALRSVTRFCITCEYSDGFVDQFDPEGQIERSAAESGQPYTLGGNDA